MRTDGYGRCYLETTSWMDAAQRLYQKLGFQRIDSPLGDTTHDVWRADIPDANVATIEVGSDGPVGTTDADGDFSVNVLSFCTTDDCVADINDGDGQWAHKVSDFIDPSNTGVAVPFSAATSTPSRPSTIRARRA